jgi:NADPH:quinone reductase
MKAGVIERLGASPGVTSYPDPTPSTDTEVLIKVEATALNAVDLHIASGHHRAGAPSPPYVPGIEVVGRIIAGPDLGLRVRVAITAAGFVPGVSGGLAELVVTDRAACIPVPTELDSVAAAAVGVVGSSADISLRSAGFRDGESVLVLGATGPLGMAFLQLARLAGADRVIAAGRSQERLADLPAVSGVVTLGEEPLSEQLAALGAP